MAYPYPQYQPYGSQYAPQSTYLPQGGVQIPPVNTMQNTATQGLSAASRLVSSKEEAVGVPADFGGAMMVFPDITHNRIYMKRWNYQTGAADFVEYIPSAPIEPVPVPTYASAEEVKELRSALDILRDELAKLKSEKAVNLNDGE